MTYATLLTPPTTGAIAVILLTGPRAREILPSLVDIPLPRPNVPRRTRFAHNATPIDDGLLIATAPDTFELHLHGGPAVIDAVFSALAALHIPRLPPTHMHPHSLEDELAGALPRALTSTAVHLLANQPAALRQWVADVLPSLDAPWKLASRIQWLIDRAFTLDHLITPARVAIIGPPNAGKSTLANALLGRPVAITSDTPGTTRDWVDATTTFVVESETGKVEAPVTLVDTAGIRETLDPLESESIRRTHHQLAQADAAIVVLDATLPPDLSLLSSLPIDLPRVIAMNKRDLSASAPSPGAIPISALHHENLSGLMEAVLNQLNLAEIDLHEPHPFTARQRAVLQQASLAAGASEMESLLALLTNPPAPAAP